MTSTGPRTDDTTDAVAYFPAERAVRMVPPPEDRTLGPVDVVVATRYVGLCGTDRELVADGDVRVPAGYPYLVLGHELVATVVHVGTDVTGIALGDTVTAMVRRGCGDCAACAAGRADNCLTDGYEEHGIRGLHGFARPHVTLPAGLVVPIATSLDVHGVLVEPLAVVQKAVELALFARRRLGLPRGERWRSLVVGCGTVGLLCAALLRRHGHHVVAVDSRPVVHSAATVATSLGVEYVQTTSVDELAALPRHFDVAFEASGDAAVAFALHDRLAAGGVQIQVGVTTPGHVVTVDGGRRVRDDTARQLQVIGTANAARRHFGAAVADLPALLELDGFADIVTGTYPPGAFDHALHATSAIKTVLAFDHTESAPCR